MFFFLGTKSTRLLRMENSNRLLNSSYSLINACVGQFTLIPHLEITTSACNKRPFLAEMSFQMVNNTVVYYFTSKSLLLTTLNNCIYFSNGSQIMIREIFFFSSVMFCLHRTIVLSLIYKYFKDHQTFIINANSTLTMVR